MKRPWMLTREWLVTLDLRGGVYAPSTVGLADWPLSELALDAVVDGEVDCPRREVAEDRRAKPAVHAADAVVLEVVLDGRWGERGGRGRTLSSTRLAHAYRTETRAAAVEGRRTRVANVKPLTDHALVGFVSMDGALCLQLGLDDIQRAGGDAGDETASCASWVWGVWGGGMRSSGTGCAW